MHYLLEPHSTTPEDAFREPAICLIILIAGVFFSILFLIEMLVNETHPGFFWYVTILGIIVSVYLALHLGRVHLASRILMLGMFLIVIDTTASYWTPGTIVLGIIFTFMIQILFVDRRERYFFMTINLGIYTVIALANNAPAPLPPNDYYSSWVTVILTTYVAHIIIIGVIHFVRHEQYLRDQQMLMLEQQRVDVLRQFLGNSSHDLRTQLTRISSSLQLAKLKMPDIIHPQLNKIESASHDLEKILLSMLEVLQLEAGSEIERSPVTIKQLFDYLLAHYEAMANNKSQKLVVQGEIPEMTVLLDEVLMRRALGNMVQNAIIYSPEASDIHLSCQLDHKILIITIQDYGRGIPADQLPLIFDSFYRGDDSRNQETGLNGLGLSISKKIIELHQGTISLQSAIGEGTTFTIRLPMMSH